MNHRSILLAAGILGATGVGLGAVLKLLNQTTVCFNCIVGLFSEESSPRHEI